MKIVDTLKLERQKQLNDIRLNRLFASSENQKVSMFVDKNEQSGTFALPEKIWFKKQYKKKDKIWHLKSDFLNWIPYEANYSMSIKNSRLFFDRRDRDFVFKIPYRQLNMLPGNKYTVSVKFSTDEEKMDIDFGSGGTWNIYPKFHIACGKMFETFADFYRDMYGEYFSDDDANEQVVSAVLDFSGLKDKIPGVLLIGMLHIAPNLYPSFYIDWIKVYNETVKKEVYFNDFIHGMYEAVMDTKTEPGENTDWIGV